MALHLRVEQLDDLAVGPVGPPGGLDRQRNIRYVQGAAIGEGGVGVGQLEGRYRVLALADRFLDLEARFPNGIGIVLGVLLVLFGHHLGVGDDAGVFPR